MGRKWHNLSKEEQQVYYDKAREAREKHLELYPEWSARDNYGKKKRRKKEQKERERQQQQSNSIRMGSTSSGINSQMSSGSNAGTGVQPNSNQHLPPPVTNIPPPAQQTPNPSNLLNSNPTSSALQPPSNLPPNLTFQQRLQQQAQSNLQNFNNNSHSMHSILNAHSLADTTQNKKCRAIYGLEAQNLWCAPCRRKKKCIRFMDEEDKLNLINQQNAAQSLLFNYGLNNVAAQAYAAQVQAQAQAAENAPNLHQLQLIQQQQAQMAAMNAFNRPGFKHPGMNNFPATSNGNLPPSNVSLPSDNKIPIKNEVVRLWEVILSLFLA